MGHCVIFHGWPTLPSHCTLRQAVFFRISAMPAPTCETVGSQWVNSLPATLCLQNVAIWKKNMFVTAQLFYLKDNVLCICQFWTKFSHMMLPFSVDDHLKVFVYVKLNRYVNLYCQRIALWIILVYINHPREAAASSYLAIIFWRIASGVPWLLRPTAVLMQLSHQCWRWCRLW